ncbi:MAG: hypothetical protein WC285_01290 [Candidatus Gracilibacteria bacterium]|jgi:hypothetical protein
METFKTRLKRLPLKEKLVLIGGFLIIIGSFLPWYQDVDKFRTGDTFLGISGPLYLAGLIVLIGGIMSFGTILWKLLGKPAVKFPVNENYVHLLGASLSILMIILTTSVYFHPKFGINLTEKTVGTGMIMAMIGVGLIILGSVLAIKNRNISFEEEGKLEPLIDINDRVQSDIKPAEKIPFGSQKSINSFLEQHETLNSSDINTPKNE